MAPRSKSGSGGLPSQRQLRVGEQLRHMIAETLQRGRFHDEALLDNAPMVTVTEVRPSPDLKHATAYVIGADAPVLAALNDSAPYFQQQINRKSQLKFTPKLRFVEDKGFEQAQRIDQLLSNLKKSDG